MKRYLYHIITWQVHEPIENRIGLTKQDFLSHAIWPIGQERSHLIDMLFYRTHGVQFRHNELGKTAYNAKYLK